MKAISTRYIGATDHRPARILASDQDGNRYVLPADGDFPYTTVHQAAAVALCRSMGWPGAESLVGGTVKVGMVWVFTHDVPPAPDSDRALLARTLPMLVTLGDHIGNGPIDPARPGSLGARCDLIGDIRDRVEAAP